MSSNTPRNAKYCDKLKSVNEVEDRSGLELSRALKDDKQEQLEAGTATLADKLGCQ